MKPTLAIVGASTRAAAASAVRAGFQPITADLFADADLRAIATATRISPYPEGLLDWIRTVEPPAWMYTGALENYPELVDQMAWIAPLWGNPGDVLAQIRSPWELAALLRHAGLLFPETRASAEGIPTDSSWLAKTYRGASGSGVRVYDESFAASLAMRSTLHGPDSSPLCFQRRLAGTPLAAVFVASDGKASLIGITRQLVGESWLGANQFQYCGSIGPYQFSPQHFNQKMPAAVERIGNELAARFELMGVFGVDLVVDENRVFTIEVNPRFTASVETVERATGIAVLALHAEACGERKLDTPPWLPTEWPMHGKAILFAKRDVVVPGSFAEWALADALKKPWPMVADTPTVGTLIEEGRPIATVFAEAESADGVELALRNRVASLEQMLYPGVQRSRG